MSISSIGNQNQPYAHGKNQGCDSIQSLQKKRELLTKQLEEVKSRPKNSQAEQEAAAARKKALESQIQKID